MGSCSAFKPPTQAILSERDTERIDGAGDRDRTGDIQLGKLAFYR